MLHKEKKQTLLELCKHLHSKDYLAAADGNISCRIDTRRILITPAGRHKMLIGIPDIAMSELTGETVSGNPSTEILLHCAIYQACGAATWVIHAHPPNTIAWTLVNPTASEMEFSVLPEVLLGIGTIPVVPYLLPGSKELADAVAKVAKGSRVVIMARHGLISWGESAEEALNGIERTEHAFKILLSALKISSPPLPLLEESLQRQVKNLRKRRGDRSL